MATSKPNVPPVRPISHEQQLQLQNEMFKDQLQRQMTNRALETRLHLAAFMDGILFTIQATRDADEVVAAEAKQDLANLKELIDVIVSGEWATLGQSSGRIVLP